MDASPAAVRIQRVQGHGFWPHLDQPRFRFPPGHPKPPPNGHIRPDSRPGRARAAPHRRQHRFRPPRQTLQHPVASRSRVDRGAFGGRLRAGAGGTAFFIPGRPRVDARAVSGIGPIGVGAPPAPGSSSPGSTEPSSTGSSTAGTRSMAAGSGGASSWRASSAAFARTGSGTTDPVRSMSRTGAIRAQTTNAAVDEQPLASLRGLARARAPRDRAVRGRMAPQSFLHAERRCTSRHLQQRRARPRPRLRTRRSPPVQGGGERRHRKRWSGSGGHRSTTAAMAGATWGAHSASGSKRPERAASSSDETLPGRNGGRPATRQ